jgi:proton glutamate symport protein
LPLGVFALVAKTVAAIGLESITSVGYFFFTVLLGLTVYMFIALPILLKFIAKVSPIAHIKAMAPALITAFSTTSSAATLPVTLECVEKKIGVSNRIASFMLPLGSSVNLAGSSLQVIVAVFTIAQIYGLDLSFSTQIVVFTMTLLLSFGMAGIPSASLISIMLILTTIGFPADGVGLILAVERILDMFRTTVNVFSNSCCAVLVARSEGEDLKI